MCGLWFTLFLWLSRNIFVTSNNIFVMTSDKCITNTTFPMYANLKAKTINAGRSDNDILQDFLNSNYFKDWQIKDAIDNVILDGKWKGLTVHNFKNDQLRSYSLNITLLSDRNVFPISIQGTKIQNLNMQLFFCTDEDDSQCIWFGLNQHITVRHCNSSDINYPKTGKCVKFADRKNLSKIYEGLNDTQWIHLTIRKKMLKWIISVNGHTIFEYNQTDERNFFKKAKIFSSNSFIMTNKFKYLYINTTGTSTFRPTFKPGLNCYIIYIKMCTNCFLDLIIKNGEKVLFNETYTTNIWKKITIKLPERKKNVTIYFTRVSNDVNNLVWSLSNFSPCSEINQISRRNNEDCNIITSAGHLKISGKSYNETKIQKSKTSCNIDEFGLQRCFPCADYLCGNSKLCEISSFNITCYCPSGTMIVEDLNDCKKCTTGLYGWNCTESCEGCAHGCNYKGLCIIKNDSKDICKSKEYSGEYCDKIPKTPTGIITWNQMDTFIFHWNYSNIVKQNITFLLELNNVNYSYSSIGQKNIYMSEHFKIAPETEIYVKLRACIRICSSYILYNDSSYPSQANITINDIELKPASQMIVVTFKIMDYKCKKSNTIILLAINKRLVNDLKNKDNYNNNNIIREFNNTNLPKYFLIGSDEDTFSVYFNRTVKNHPLKPDSQYNFSIRVINIFMGKESIVTEYWQVNTTSTTTKMTKTVGWKIPFAILFLILAIIVTGGILYIKKNKSFNRFNRPSVTETSLDLNQELSPLKDHQPPSQDLKFIAQSYKMPNTKLSRMVLLIRFERYIRNALEKNELEQQYLSVPKGQMYPWTVASCKENMSKNRYGNILAYDRSRVVLETIGSDEYSDYINANFIDGYLTKNAYIACQGPKLNTLNDFWRMVWQENVQNIIMVANLVEESKKKVTKYWPDLNKNQAYLNITVATEMENIFTYYTYRRFRVCKNRKTREINHLHYTYWPDHGVPLYSQTMVPFLKKIGKIKTSSTSPIVVHCSAGVGRTGTIILCDLTLRMAKAEKRLDILNFLEYIRSRRPNLVDNYEQYMFVHMVVLEYLFGLNTGIPCNDSMESAAFKIIANGIEEQQMYLKEIEWQDDVMKTNKKNKLNVQTDKNRFNSIIPDKYGCVYLTPLSDESTSYINAVYVECYQEPNRFIATQQPLPSTVSDFWRMVADTNSSVIISLNEVDFQDKTSCIFWPEYGEVINVTDDIFVEHEKTDKFKTYEVVRLRLKKYEENCAVDLILFQNWKPNQFVPTNIQEFVSFLRETDQLLRKSKPAIVTCFDGTTACGVYLATLFIIEKIKIEQVCDICQAVRYIRHNRKQFILEKKQFVFLYQAAIEFVKGSQTYANFF